MNVRSTNALNASGATKARGFTLVELMVAMLLGLIVIAGVSSVFLANLRSYKSNTALGDVQSNARIAFEIMARDIRQAGLTGCNSTTSQVVNTLYNGPGGSGTQVWWAQWNHAVHGYESTQTDPAITGAAPARAASTDSLTLMEAAGQGLTVASAGTTPPSLTLADDSSNLQTGDVVVVCDPDKAAIMQVTGYVASTVTVNHATGGTTAPGNFSAGPNFMVNSKVSALGVHDWYIGINPLGGRSLYRISLTLNGGVPTPTAQEMVRNLTDMQIAYHQSGDADFLDADAVTRWGDVDAVRINFTLQSADQRAGTDAKPLTRTFASTTTIRNREANP